MTLQELIKENTDHIEWKIKMKEVISEQNKRINAINKSNFPLDEFKALSYLEAKKTYETIHQNLEHEQCLQLEEVLEEIKINDYPALSIAHYYPVINEIDYLDANQKKQLDEVLRCFSNKNYLITTSSIWFELNFNEELTEKILNFLYKKGILQKNYAFYCSCGSEDCDPLIITREQYDKFIAYHSVTRSQFDNMTDEEKKDHNNRWEEGYFEVPCWNDGNKEICSIEDLQKNAKEYFYKIIAAPDLTYETL